MQFETKGPDVKGRYWYEQFRVLVDKTVWLIQVEVLQEDRHRMVEKIVADWDGNNLRILWRKKPFGKTVKSQSLGLLQAEVLPLPLELIPLWGSFCAGSYFRDFTIHATPPWVEKLLEISLNKLGQVEYGRLSVQNRRGVLFTDGVYYAVRVGVPKAKPPLDIPNRLELFGYVYQPSERIFYPVEGWIASFGKLPKLAELTVEKWAVARNQCYPKYIIFRIWHIQEENPLVQAHVEVTNVFFPKKIHSQDFISAKDKIQIEDRRLFQEIKREIWHFAKPIYYTTNRWLTMKELRSSDLFIDFLTNLRKTQVAYERKRIGLTTLTFILIGLVISPICILSLRQVMLLKRPTLFSNRKTMDLQSRK
ncbi:hypothetical protein J7L33_02695 [Candidatus Bathyarchaeota archaeon]|nr:hypothetical protein [Candidatus Bathyarchaeota archaeon]